MTEAKQCENMGRSLMLRSAVNVAAEMGCFSMLESEPIMFNRADRG